MKIGQRAYRTMVAASVACGLLIAGGFVWNNYSRNISAGTANADTVRSFKKVQPLLDPADYPSDLAQLRIAEVFLSENGIWAELYCARGSADLRHYRLTDLDGEDRPLADRPAVLSAGEFVIVHWGEGDNETDDVGDLNGDGFRDLFLGQVSEKGEPFDKPPSRSIDQLVLVHEVGQGQKWIDAVCWTMPGQEPERWEKDDVALLTERGLWNGAPIEVSPVDGVSWVHQDLLNASASAATWILAAVATPGMGTDAADIPEAGTIEITEVNPLADRRAAFAEIRCTEKAPDKGVNIHAFVLTALDGPSTPLSPFNLTLKPGEFALCRWGISGRTEIDGLGDENGNGYRDIYLPAQEAPVKSGDVLVLSLGGRIYDAVAWLETGTDPAENFRKDLAEIASRGTTVLPVKLSEGGPFIARSGARWFATSLPSPGALSRLVRYPKEGSVRIAEVLPEGAKSWAEIEIDRDAPAEGIDVSLFSLSDMDGKNEPLATQPLTLKPGERLLVRWQDGDDEVDAVGDANKNGIREVCVSATNPPSSTTDQLVLYLAGRMYDALAWTSPEGKISAPEAEDLQNLRKAGISAKVSRPEGSSVARINGKIQASADPTPGKANDIYLSRPFGTVRIAAFQVARDRAWVEIEAQKGTSDISRIIVTDMDDKDQPLSEDPIILKQGERAKIIWGKKKHAANAIDDRSRDGMREVFLDEDAPSYSADQIVIKRNGKMLDAVVFSRYEGSRFAYPEQDDVKILRERGLWKTGSLGSPNALVTQDQVVKRRGASTWTR